MWAVYNKYVGNVMGFEKALLISLLVGVFFSAALWAANWFTAREINNRYDRMIDKKPHNSDLYNMLRYHELKDEKKAEEYFHKDISARAEKLLEPHRKINQILKRGE